MNLTLKKRITLIFSLLGFVSFVFIAYYKYVSNKYHTAQHNITQHNHLMLKINAVHNYIDHLDTVKTDRVNVLTDMMETGLDVNKLYYTFFDHNHNDTVLIEQTEKEVYLSHRNDILLVYDIKMNYDKLHRLVSEYIYTNKGGMSEGRVSKSMKLYTMKEEAFVLLKVIEDDLYQIEPYYKGKLDKWLLIEKYSLYTYFLVLFSLMLSSVFHLYNIIINPISKLYHFVSAHTDVTALQKRGVNDEIGELISLSLKNEREIVQIRKHLRKISDGEFDTKLALEDGTLHPLLTEEVQSLQENLVKSKIATERYNWSVEGLSTLNESLNKKYETIESLVESVLSTLVQYSKARQGAVFVISKEDKEEVLVPRAVYAYGVKKKSSQVVHKGEGLLGEVWEERKTFYYTDIPKGHMRIKSGLGDAQPTNLLITPLISGLETYGVMELGFFHSLQKHEIEFIEKVSVNLAIALSGIDVHNKTKMLLIESQALSSSLQEKESELEANIEQLRETHEETQRRELQNQRDIKLLSEKYELQIHEFSKKEEGKAKEINLWKQKVEEAKTDNELVRSLQEEIKQFEPQITDLKETIKIKDMRIEKLRKKLRDNK